MVFFCIGAKVRKFSKQIIRIIRGPADSALKKIYTADANYRQSSIFDFVSATNQKPYI